MIFYHFTRPENVEAIMRDGLLAKNENPGNDATFGKKVVWLTEKPTNAMSLQRRKMMLKRGILCGPRFRNLPLATVCLKTVIPTRDRKLHHYSNWLRKHHPAAAAVADEFPAEWWFYAGDISASRIEVFKHVPRGTVSWELPEHKDWLEGATLAFAPGLEDDLLAARAGPEDYIKENSLG
jgi:hypothetical protein